MPISPHDRPPARVPNHQSPLHCSQVRGLHLGHGAALALQALGIRARLLLQSMAVYALRMAIRCGRARHEAMRGELITFPTSATMARATSWSSWRVAFAHIAAMAPET